MELKIISEEKLIDLKNNLEHLAPKFKQKDNSWLKEYFRTEDPFIKTKYTINDIKLDMSQEKEILTDFNNVKIIYENLKFLTNSQASEERLWAGLALGEFWDYVQYRWKIEDANSIKQHYFYGYGPRRSLTRNAISRLWWIGKLTYDESRESPYELTKFVCENADNVMHILERNISNNKDITKAFLSAIIDAQKQGIQVNTDTVGEISKYLNLLGGVYILDAMSFEEIYSKVHSKLVEMDKSKTAIID